MSTDSSRQLAVAQADTTPKEAAKKAEAFDAMKEALRQIAIIGESELVLKDPKHGNAPHKVALIARDALRLAKACK